MYRIWTLILALVGSSFFAFAIAPYSKTQKQDFYLVLYEKSGVTAKYRFDTHPRIKYKDGEFWIISDEVKIAYPVNDVRKFVLSKEESSDEDPVEDSDVYLVLWEKNGSVATYHLNTHPRIKYKNGNFWVISDEVEIVYPENEVRKFTLSKTVDDIVDGIERLPDTDGQNHNFSFDKARPGSIVDIYDINGRKLGTYTIGADGNLTYSLDNRPAGMYLIKTETTTIKIIKK